MTTTEKETTMKLSEMEMQTLVRNALMVAGKEMGEEGDHWPVIKNTITDVTRDWENLRVEREVHAEMKRHLYDQLSAMEQILLTCTPEEQKELAPRLSELRQVYDAFFTRVANDDENELYFEDIEEPLHIRRAHAIIDTLDEETDHEE